MISAFRRYLETWVVRGLFLILLFAFVTWGVGDVVRLVGSNPTWVAKIGDQTIEGPVFQAEFQRNLNQATRNLPPGQDATPELKRQVGDATLQRLIGQAALRLEQQRLRVVTPDPAVREAVVGMPNFRDNAGRFSRQAFESALRTNGLSEPQFLTMMRSDLAQRQMLEAVAAGGVAPQAEAAPLYAEQYEKRSADMAEFAIAAAPAPADPTDAELQRWYDNHPDRYSAPELRRIKAILLSPQTLAKEIEVTDAELAAEYDRRKAQYVTPGRRSAQVLSVPDQAKATGLAEKWRGGADWAAMQAAAQQDGGSAVQLDDATEGEFPDAGLASTVFAATPNAVSDPVHGALGWYVVQVVKATPGENKTLDQVKDEVRGRVLADKATDLMYERANKVDNLLGNGTPLDQMPGDLGLAGIAGTMDSNGLTKDGTPAPIPGPPELKTALIAAAFRAQKGDPPQLSEVPTPSAGGSAYFAFTVEDIIPPALQPFDEVKTQVTADRNADQQRHAAETAAAGLLAALKGGQSLADAAAVAGVPVRHTPLATRAAAPEEIPTELTRVLFSLKQGEPTMVETPDAFIVAVPVRIEAADSKADPGGYARLQEAVNRSIGGDLASVFSEALRLRANPAINQQNYDSIVQPQ